MPVNNWARGAQCRIIGELHGQQTVNVMHFGTDLVANDQGEVNTILLALVEAMRDCVVQFLLPSVTSDWRFVRTEAQMVFPTKTDPILATGTPLQVGELSPTSVSFSAMLVNIRSGFGGRRGRGKIFLPPPGESEIQTSLIDEPTLVLLAAFTACVAAKFMGAAPESEWHLGILSIKDAGTPQAGFNAGFRLAASLNPSATVAKMGSRKVNHGS